MPDNTHRWTRYLELASLAVGIGLRLGRYLEPRPLWIDEVFIALNVLPRSPLDFLRPLDHNQISPLGFLVGEWVMTRVAGGGEHALRFLPLVASVVALIAFARFVRRTLEPRTALLATALAALSPLLIIYAGEVKSYAFDWLFVVLLMNATLSLAERTTPAAFIRWSVTAGLAALMSTAAPFFVAGCAFSLLAVPTIRRSAREWLRLAVAVAPAAILFGAQLLTTYSSDVTRPEMKSFWASHLLDPRLPDAVVQAAQLSRLFVLEILFGDRNVDVLPPKSMTIIMLISAVGVFALARRSVLLVLMVVAPATLAVVASLLQVWPLTARLLLFAAPLVVVALAAGLAALTRLLPSRSGEVAFAGLSVLLVVACSAGLWREWPASRWYVDVPDALRGIRRDVGTNATVYLSTDMVHACQYYLGWHPDRDELGADTTMTDCALRGTTTLSGNWPLFSYPAGKPPFIRPEWLEQEGSRILAAAPEKVWLLLGRIVQLNDSLPAWLERQGLRRVGERQERTFLLIEYSKGAGRVGSDHAARRPVIR